MMEEERCEHSAGYVEIGDYECCYICKRPMGYKGFMAGQGFTRDEDIPSEALKNWKLAKTTFMREEEKESWEKELRIAYFKKYEGILPDKVISDSADWLIEFIEPYFENALSSQLKEVVGVIESKRIGATYYSGNVVDKNALEIIEARQDSYNQALDDLKAEVEKLV